jgi:hypothetical protein
MHQGEVPDAVHAQLPQGIHQERQLRFAVRRGQRYPQACGPLGHGRRPDGRHPQAAFVERAGDTQGFVVVADDHRLDRRR